MGFQKDSPHDAMGFQKDHPHDAMGLQKYSARNTFGSSHQDVSFRDPDEIMQRFPWLRKSLTEGLQWQTSSSTCTWSIPAALARACGTQDVHEFEVMIEMLGLLDNVASLKFGDEERDGGDR